MEFGNLDEVKKLLADDVHGPDINGRNHDLQSPLYQAISEKHNDIVEYLIRQGADIQQKSLNERTPFHIAALRNNYIAVNLLLANLDEEIVK